MTVAIRFKGASKFERDLKTFAAKAIPYANRNALNDTAFAARKRWLTDIGMSFTLRNTWTVKSVRVVKAEGTNIPRQEAVLGSTAKYMADAEHGVTQRTRGKHGLPLPTSRSAGQQGRARTRPIQRRNYLRALQMRRSRKGKQHERNASAIAHALSTGRRVAFVEAGQYAGIVRITGSKRRPKLHTIYDLSRKTTVTKPEPTLGRTVIAARGMAPAVYQAAVLAQLRRNKVFGY